MKNPSQASFLSGFQLSWPQTPTSSSEKKSQEWAESQTLLVILAYKVKEGRWGGDGITSKEEKEQRNIENGTEKYDRNRQKGEKRKRKKLQG